MIPCWKTMVIELAHLQVLSVNAQTSRETAEHFLFHCTKYHHIRKRTLLNQHWIYWNVPKSPVYQTILNFCYFLQPSTVSSSLRTELLKIYCLNFFLALNERYNLLPSLTFLQRCYYSRWSMHWILPTFLYLLQSHHWTVFTVKSLYRGVFTCGAYHDVTGRATGRRTLNPTHFTSLQDIQQQRPG